MVSRATTIKGVRGQQGGGGSGEKGRSCDAPKVLTEMLKGTAVPAERGKLVGTAQLAPKGAPEHVKLKVPLKPAPGMAWRLNCAACPAEMEDVVDPPADVEMLTAGAPVPLTVRD